MSVWYEDECCDCATESYPCIGSSCPNRSVPHYDCDDCKNEFEPDELYDYNGEILCAECLLDRFETIKAEE